MRCLGTLKYAKLVDNKECLSMLSSIRMGVSEKIIEGITLDEINALMTETQPATLTKNADKELTAQQRDKERANILRHSLKNL